MDFNRVISSISKKYHVDILRHELKTRIENIILLSDDIIEWRTDTLYIGYSNYLPNVIPCSIQAIFCDTVMNNLNQASLSNIAVINEKDLNSIFNQINCIFYQSLRLAVEFSKLVAMTIRGENITSIINVSARQLGNPIIVVDNSYHVLCFSNNHEITDPFWVENIKRGYCTYEFIVAVNEILANQETPDDSTSFIVHCPVTPKSKLCAKIIWNDMMIGYIIMLEEDTLLQNFQMEYLPKISYIVGDMLSKSPDFESIQGSNSEHILHHMLNGEDEYNLKARIDAARLIFPDKMRCITLGTKHSSNLERMVDSKNLLRFYKERLNPVFPDNYSTHYKDNIIFITSVNSDEKFSEIQEATLTELFEKGILTIGVSEIFGSIYHLPQQFQKCITLQQIALQIGIINQLMYYENFIFEAIFNHTQDKYQLLSYIHPALTKLRDYDQQMDSRLYETLCIYLECKFNFKQTSAKLFIHRNSLTYRMDKILELTKLNLEDMNTLFWLEMSYRMEKFIN